MAVGKNPNKQRYAKKGAAKKKVVDPFTRKEWYDVQVPAVFRKRTACKTIVNRTQGTKIASDALKGRVFEVNLADLQSDETKNFRKMKFRVEDVSGKQALTNFYGMDFTTDKLRSLVRKWHTLIEGNIDVKTADGYVLRLFCIAQTRRRNSQVKKTSYATSAQIKRIRRKMFDIITKHVTTSDLRSLTEKLIAESIGEDIARACAGVYPLQNVFIRKVKMIKAPKFDVSKLLEVHSGGPSVEVAEDAGKAL